MKKRKGLIAAVVFIILVTAINQFLNYALVQPGLGRTMFYECKNNDYECLILGASHGSYGFDSSKMSEELGMSTMNMCIGGEYMYDAYYILKYALKYKKLKTVILDLDYQYFVNQHDESILFNNVYKAYPACNEKFGYYMHKMAREEYRGTFLRWTNYWQCYKTVGKTIKLKQSDAYKNYSPEVVSMNKYDTYMGNGFVSRSKDYKKSTTSCLDWDENKLDREEGEYVGKIVNLCRKNGINIVLTTVVQDPDTVSEKCSGFAQADAYLSNLATQLDVKYLNFNKLKFDVLDRTTDDFYDKEGHMYGDMAEKFSAVCAKAVKEAIADTLNEEDYFDKDMSNLYKK